MAERQGRVKRNNGAGADHAVMRELNRSVVLDVLKSSSPISRAGIASTTKLAKPTVSAIVDDLIGDGLVREIGPGATTVEGGRPPILLEFNTRSRFFVGVHIGVRRTNVVVTDAQGLELARCEAPTTGGAPEETLTAVAELAKRALSDARAPKSKVGALGVCVPGLVDLDNGTCVFAPNLGWRDVPVRQFLRTALRTSAPTFVLNTAQACAVAEAVEGAARGAQQVVLIYAGTGIGAGLIIDGRLYRGVSGIAGELGHVKIAGAVDACTCGGRGCLETLIAAPALERAAGRPLEDLAADAARGDSRAEGFVRTAGAQLGAAAGWLVNIWNPEVVVVGGGLSEAGDAFMDAFTGAVQDASLPASADALTVRKWSLGQDAKVRGAVLVAMQAAERSMRLLFGSSS